MMFLDYIKKLFSTKEDGHMSEKTSDNNRNPQPKRKHKLEIQVYEADYEKADANNGQPQWRPVRSDPILDGGRPNIIEVADKREFDEIQQQYAMCDQRIKVIREIDPFVDDPPEASPEASTPQGNKAVPVQQSTSSLAAHQDTVVVQVPVAAASPMPAAVEPVKPKAKPKVVTIGDIEVKYDGDKVYQKQWMKLTPSESSNFRVVNESSNKVVSMAGKRIEAKRWVLVEESSGTSDDVVESLIGE